MRIQRAVGYPSGEISPTDEATGQSVEVTAANRKQLGFRTVVHI